MKRIFFAALFLFIFQSTHAIALQDIPDDFRPHCFEYSTEMELWNMQLWNVYKLLIDKPQDLIILQGNILLPYKKYETSGSLVNYTNSRDYSFATLNDANSKTSVEFDSSDAEIIFTLNEVLESGTFDFKINSQLINHKYVDVFVSENGISFSEISGWFSNIEKYHIKSLKIVYADPSNKRDKFTISELSFIKKYDTYLFRPAEDKNIVLYSSFKCSEWTVPKDRQVWTFDIDVNTASFYLGLAKNPSYNPQSFLDSDGDGIDNGIDNCRNVYNPDQADADWDRSGDLCSDDDSDWVIWHKDNCITVANADQKDANINGVWDVCEFDKDSDGVYDGIDNCITIANPDQADSDRDNIWNACDNCAYYNPRQLDKDNNSIGDVCDQKEKYLLENDDDSDGIENSRDNCSEIANSDQLDSDKDGIWNACDNCSNMQNANQLDSNENNIWDICEDSDSDGIQGLEDNCINIANSDQKDSDNNGVWDVCEDSDRDNILFTQDNCPYDYNPDQANLDSDALWDVCDDSDDRYIESNKTFFIMIALLIGLLFVGGIGFMLHKLNTK